MTTTPRAMVLTLAVIGVAGAARAADAPAAPSFSKDVAPILYGNCVVCHRPGEVAINPNHGTATFRFKFFHNFGRFCRCS